MGIQESNLLITCEGGIILLNSCYNINIIFTVIQRRNSIIKCFLFNINIYFILVIMII